MELPRWAPIAAIIGGALGVVTGVWLGLRERRGATPRAPDPSLQLPPLPITPSGFTGQTLYYSWLVHGDGSYQPLLPQRTARDVLEINRSGNLTPVIVVKTAGAPGVEPPLFIPDEARYGVWSLGPLGWNRHLEGSDQVEVQRVLAAALPNVYFWLTR